MLLDAPRVEYEKATSKGRGKDTVEIVDASKVGKLSDIL